MKRTTQPHKHMLRRICTLGRVAGWAMIAMGVLGLGSLAYAVLVVHIGIGVHGYLKESLGVVDHILAGLLVLGVVQFIRYVVEEGTEPGWLLRKGHVILCVFALSLLLTWGLRDWPRLWDCVNMFLSHPPGQMIPMGRELGVAGVTLIFLLPPIAKALCVLGAAAMLRTVLPILAESKTLA